MSIRGRWCAGVWLAGLLLAIPAGAATVRGSVTPWLANLSLTAHYQRTQRVLENFLPVQFPAPAVSFFPISVFRLAVLSETEQRVWTPGVDLQAVVVPAANHVLTRLAPRPTGRSRAGSAKADPPVCFR